MKPVQNIPDIASQRS